MRIWTLHPRYLDDATLREAWRDGLAARRRLVAGSKGRPTDPLIHAIAACKHPVRVIDAYLSHLHQEAQRRGKAFDRSRIDGARAGAGFAVDSERVRDDWDQLMARMAEREPARHERQAELRRPHCHPAFKRIPGKGSPP